MLLATTSGYSSNPFDFWRVAERRYQYQGTQDIKVAGNIFSLYSGTTSYFRITKAGTTYTGWWSSNGTDWNLSGSSSSSQQWKYIGFDVIRQNYDGKPNV
jgi:hypothetical protein